MQNRNTIYAILVAILLIAAAWYLFDHKVSSSQPTSGAVGATSSTQQVTTSTTSVSNGKAVVNNIVTTGNAGYTVNVVPNTTAAKAPDYTKPITFSSSISVAVKTALQTQFNITVAAIAKDKYDFNAWVDLGSQHHMAGDDHVAATIWEYISATWPTNVASYNNLGDLYANYLKDYAKAESNYLNAIKNKPDDSNPYKNLFTLYYNAGYNKAKAETILKQGIVAVPKAVDMQVLLARYYRDAGRTAEAKAEYSLAIKNAQSQGQTDLATTLQAESSAF